MTMAARLAALALSAVLSALPWGGLAAQDGQALSAMARVVPGSASLRESGGAVDLTLTLSQGVPYRLFTLDRPRRLVLDFYEVDWTGLQIAGLAKARLISGLRTGIVRPGWSRMVLDLAEPLAVDTAALITTPAQTARVVLRLVPTSAQAYARAAGAPPGAFASPGARPSGAASLPEPRQRWHGEGPLTVVLDPGHGGIDPGAQRQNIDEADLMLTFARELKEILLRAGGFKVVMTRDQSVFVPLETRVSIARQAGADLFLSLHADALLEGRATGSTVYTLSDKASDLASQKLAERHDRGDLLAGVDLRGQDDSIALVLMDIARTETAPLSDMLAEAIVSGLRARVGVRKKPHLSAGFSVLKAPDIPSVLIEIGFMSSPRDLKRLKDAAWRRKAAMGIRDGLQAWASEVIAQAPLLRK